MPEQYLSFRKIKDLPRLPLEGSIDLTYRCNDNCRHCWVRITLNAKEKHEELSFAEIKIIVDTAKKMGCRSWNVSGGEPMLRPDFPEIFDYITRNCATYSLNTNGTLITPKIANLMQRKGSKMVALYGATAKVHDYITRKPGSFEQAMRGFAYLKEAGAGFIVQVIPMRDNYHQFKEMIALAKSLSKHYRIGASWLYLSASGDKKINQEIWHQRLPPKEVVQLDSPDLSYEECLEKQEGQDGDGRNQNACLFSSCIARRCDFHIDPYGAMSFCCFIKDLCLRYDLKTGSFRDCWERFIPSLAHKIKVTQEYQENCGSCELREGCPCCPVYAYLEHRRFSAKINYLCKVAKERKKFRQDFQGKHRRYFRTGDITIRVESDLPARDTIFHPKIKFFAVDGQRDADVTIRHHFYFPDLEVKNLGIQAYRKPPWAIYKKGDSWIYRGIGPRKGDRKTYSLAVFNHDHTQARIYHNGEEDFLEGRLSSLTLFPTDQVWLAQVLADRQGCYLHSCGVILEGKGLLFAGHSGAGKSTMAMFLRKKAQILCDDRIIVRNTASSFKIYGTWSHGDVPDTSPNSAPLRAILFLEKSKMNSLILINDKKEITKRLLSYLIRPLVTVAWWEKMLTLIGQIAQEVPCYVLRFSKDGGAVELLKEVTNNEEKMGETKVDRVGKG